TGAGPPPRRRFGRDGRARRASRPVSSRPGRGRRRHGRRARGGGRAGAPLHAARCRGHALAGGAGGTRKHPAPRGRRARQGIAGGRAGRRTRPHRETRRGMVRVLIAGLVTMVIAVVIGPTFIDWLKRRSVGQQIRAEGPAGHHVKQGTPTMGGLLILFAALAPFFVLSVYTVAGLTVMGTALGCGLIGFA